MEIKSIILCESVTHHPDNTFSLLRGGINRWNLKVFPAQIGFSFAITFEFMSTEIQKGHTAELDVTDADGNRVIPQAKITLNITPQLNTSRYVFNVVGILPNILINKPGSYTLHVGVNGHHLADTDFQVIQTAQ